MIHGFHHAATMARDCLARSTTCTKRASLGPDDPQLFGSVQNFFVETKSEGGVHIHSDCRPHWAALRGKLRLPHPKHLTSSTLQTSPLDKRCCLLLTIVTRLAWVEQHRPRREGGGIGHQNDGLLCHVPAHVAHRQLEAEPEEPEEQRVDVLQVVSEPTSQHGATLL